MQIGKKWGLTIKRTRTHSSHLHAHVWNPENKITSCLWTVLAALQQSQAGSTYRDKKLLMKQNQFPSLGDGGYDIVGSPHLSDDCVQPLQGP